MRSVRETRWAVVDAHKRWRKLTWVEDVSPQASEHLRLYMPCYRIYLQMFATMSLGSVQEHTRQ